MPRRSHPKKFIVAQMLKAAAALSDVELRSLISGLEVMESNRPEGVERDEHGKPVNQKGYVEEKCIKGCGPYRYLRYWDGKRHRSVYLGKKKHPKISAGTDPFFPENE